MNFEKENTGRSAAPNPLHIRPNHPPRCPPSLPSPTYRPQSLSIDLRVSETKSECDTEKCASAANQHSKQDDTELEVPYSVFTTAEKRLIVTIAALTTLIPPLTGSMYYPVIPTLAHDLNVSVNDISYTITAYLIVQGIAPSFLGSLSDESGRRPALIVALIIYIAGCIGAAFRNDYALLLVMRCVQSAGGSGTIAMSLATVSDIVTSAERGTYTSYVQMGWMIGPAIGPVLGGLLSQYLGWKSIFWFLAIFAAVVLAALLLFMPETSRAIVGNGSVPSSRWNRPLITYLQHVRFLPSADKPPTTDPRSTQSASSTKKHTAHLSPLSTPKLFGQKETSCLLIYSGLIYASSYVVVSTFPSQLQTHYRLSTLHISLCYLPAGAGTIASVLLTGRILDWNFRRHARRLNIPISKQKQQDLSGFPIELVRLQTTLPLLGLAGACLLAYGWTMQAGVSLAAPMVFLFLQAFGTASAFSGMNNLVLDLERERAGRVAAAMNLSRCWLGAGGVALGGVVGQGGKAGWISVGIVGFWVVFSPLIWAVLRYGMVWREKRVDG